MSRVKPSKATRRIPEHIKRAVRARDGGRCRNCKVETEFLHFDHIVPFDLGGPNTADNIQLLCPTCNTSKGNQTTCRQCGHWMSPDKSHCTQCGARLAYTKHSKTLAGRLENLFQRVGRAVVLGGAVIVLLLLLAGGLYVASYFRGSDSTSASDQAATINTIVNSSFNTSVSQPSLFKVVVPPEASNARVVGGYKVTSGASVNFYIRAFAHLSARDLDGYESRWAANLHLNTRLPHIHLLMHKEMVDPTTGEKKVLKRLPKELLAERGSTIKDKDPARMGRISQRFKEALDEHSKPFRHIQIRDAESRILADRKVIEAGAVNERKPTFEEVSVGRWVVAEAKAARAEGESISLPLALREYVRKLDAHTAARGLDSTAAFLSQEQISELTRYRTSGLRITLHTETPDRLDALERPSREKRDRVASSVEHERQQVRRAHSSDEDQVRPNRVLKDEALKERQDRVALGTGAQIPRQAEERNLLSPPKARIEENTERFERVAVDNGEKSYPKARLSDSHPRFEASSRKKKLKAQEELFESRGRGLIEQYLALSTDPRLVKEFASAAKNQLEAGRHIESLEKTYRERYREDAPAGATLSFTDKDYLIKNVPKIYHVPSSIRNDFMRGVYTAKTSDQARSYLPREPRPFHDRRPTRDNRKGGRGR
jgi:hypothetical protein